MEDGSVLTEALGDLGDQPLTEIQTIERMRAAPPRAGSKPELAIPPEEQAELVHDMPDRHYRTLFDEPPHTGRHFSPCRLQDRTGTQKPCHLAQAPQEPLAPRRRPGRPHGDLQLRLDVAGAESRTSPELPGRMAIPTPPPSRSLGLVHGAGPRVSRISYNYPSMPTVLPARAAAAELGGLSVLPDPQ